MAANHLHTQLLQRAAASFQRGERDEVIALCARAIREFGEDANARMLLGLVSFERGDMDGSIAQLERACALLPTHIHALVNLGIAYEAVGRFAQAREVLLKAIAVDPRSARAHAVLATVLLETEEVESAVRLYERALVIQPDHADALGGLARIAEEGHDLDRARALSDKALSVDPNHVLASLTRARVALRGGDSALVARIAERILRDGSPSPNNRAIAEGYLGEAYDALGRLDGAFAAFARANEILLARHAGEFGDDRGPLALGTVRRLTAFVAQTNAAGWNVAPHTLRSPVFLIGFPRSGTTLLDQVLASHPRVTTLEERDNLADAATEMICGEGALERWSSLPAEEIERLRSRYWQHVHSSTPSESINDVFVDKLPLNAAYLPLIHRLFPSAKIVLALRDPRDAVLSCFQQRFGMNAAMFQMLRLDTAATYYDAVMSLVETSRARLPLDLHEVRYESLVGDFDAEVGALLEFLDLDWNDAVRNYAATARKRRIATPSAAQVVLPLYGHARDKWRRYQRFLEPVLPILDGWARRYGYPS